MATPGPQRLQLTSPLAGVDFDAVCATWAAAAAAATAANKEERLSQLPAELRNAIYRYALLDDKPVKLRAKEITTRKALLDTCTEIRKDATSIFWAENEFIVSSLTDHGLEEAGDILQLAGPKLCRSINHLVVRWQISDHSRIKLGLATTKTHWPLSKCELLDILPKVTAMLHGRGVRLEAITSQQSEVDEVGIGAKLLSLLVYNFKSCYAKLERGDNGTYCW